MDQLPGVNFRLKQKEGSGILVALNARIVADTHDPIAWIDGVAEDVTERKVLEMEMHYHEAEMNRYIFALTRANEKLNLLSSITRHDILNQLTALSGYLEMMGEGPLTPQTRKYIETGKRIAQTIKKQIQFTKDYHEIGVHSPQWYNVKKTIETATAPLLLQNGTLSIDTENISIYADPLLEKVFYNLVENALRYGKEKPRITFSSMLQGNSITLVCEDNGEGVPKSSKKRSSDGSSSNTPVSDCFSPGRSWVLPGFQFARAVNQAKARGLRSRYRQDISTAEIRQGNKREGKGPWISFYPGIKYTAG